MSDQDTIDPIELASELTIAWLSNPNNRATIDDVTGFLRTMHANVVVLARGSAEADGPAEQEARPEFVPAVSVRKSLASKNHILSMIDGKPYRTLRRHLSTHGLTEDEYRAPYNLKPDYPMVAPAYSEQRRAMARKIGLGSLGRAARGGAEAPTSPRKPRGKAQADA